jgi:hypothetical protein
VWVVYCIGNSREYQAGAFAQYVHTIEMSAAGGLLAELEWLEQVNAKILLGFSPYGQAEPVRVRVLKPQYPLPLDPDLLLGHIDTRSLINLGYAETKAQLQLPAQNVLPDYRATLMEEPGISFQYRAQFKGVLPDLGDVIFHAFFDLRELPNGEFVVRVFSSLALDHPPREFSTCHHHLTFTHHDGQTELHLQGQIWWEGEPRPFVAQFPLPRPGFWGLELGATTMRFGWEADHLVTFQQSFGNRLAQVWRGHVYLNAGWLARWRAKVRLKQRLWLGG